MIGQAYLYTVYLIAVKEDWIRMHTWHKSEIPNTVKDINIRTKYFRASSTDHIRLLLKDKSDQSMHCLIINLHRWSHCCIETNNSNKQTIPFRTITIIISAVLFFFFECCGVFQATQKQVQSDTIHNCYTWAVYRHCYHLHCMLQLWYQHYWFKLIRQLMMDLIVIWFQQFTIKYTSL